MAEKLIFLYWLIGSIVMMWAQATINLVTYNEAFSKCSSVDEQQFVEDSTCTSINFGNSVYKVYVGCTMTTLGSTWTFNLYQPSQFGCVRSYRLITGSSSGPGCFVAVISYTEYQYFSVRCDSSLVDVTPSAVPTRVPTTTPTVVPSRIPTYVITSEPTAQPSSSRPTTNPTFYPTHSPTVVPSLAPTYVITLRPTISPTFTPGVSFTAKYTTYNETCDVHAVPNNITVVRQLYSSGSIPNVGNCSIVPIYIRSSGNSFSAKKVALPGRVHCYGISDWTLQLFDDAFCSKGAKVFDTAKSETGCFEESNVSFAYNGITVSNGTMMFSVDCIEVFKSQSPTAGPTVRPSLAPSLLPTRIPTMLPTVTPAMPPSISPTVVVTASPSCRPTFYPTVSPTVTPSRVPSVRPTLQPSSKPSFFPTRAPVTSRPSLSLRPTTFAPTRPSRDYATLRLFASTSTTLHSFSNRASNAISSLRNIRSDLQDIHNNNARDADNNTISSFEGYIIAAEDYSQPIHVYGSHSIKARTASTSPSTSTYSSSCTKSLASVTSLQEMGRWTVLKSSCVALSSLTSLGAAIDLFSGRIESFSITCIPQLISSSSSSSSSVQYRWQVSAYSMSTSCTGTADQLYSGSSVCSCGYSNASTIVYANSSSTSATAEILAMMVDCGSAVEAATCDTGVTNSVGKNLGSTFTTSTREGLQNLVGVAIAGAVFLLAVWYGLRSAWNKYLQEHGDDVGRFNPWICTIDNWWLLMDLMIGQSLLHCCRYCCACLCCCCACWMAPSGSVTPRNAYDDDDREDGEDMFDENGLGARRNRVAAVLTMSDIRMLDSMEQGDATNAVTTAEAVAVRRRLSAASTASNATLQVSARPYDDSLDFALPTAQIAANAASRSRRAGNDRVSFISSLFSVVFPSRSRTVRRPRTDINIEGAVVGVRSEEVVTEPPPTVMDSAECLSLALYSSPDASPRRRIQTRFDANDSDDRGTTTSIHPQNGIELTDIADREEASDNVDYWDRYLPPSGQQRDMQSQVPRDDSTVFELSAVGRSHRHSSPRRSSRQRPPNRHREFDMTTTEQSSPTASVMSMSLPGSPNIQQSRRNSNRSGRTSERNRMSHNSSPQRQRR